MLLCAFLEGLRKLWGQHWFNLFKTVQKKKRGLSCVVNVPYCKEFCKSEAGSVLTEKTLKKLETTQNE